jgi:hypothetical protein
VSLVGLNIESATFAAAVLAALVSIASLYFSLRAGRSNLIDSAKVKLAELQIEQQFELRRKVAEILALARLALEHDEQFSKTSENIIRFNQLYVGLRLIIGEIDTDVFGLDARLVDLSRAYNARVVEKPQLRESMSRCYASTSGVLRQASMAIYDKIGWVTENESATLIDWDKTEFGMDEVLDGHAKDGDDGFGTGPGFSAEDPGEDWTT